jgi:hypothetical protein
MQPQTNTRKIGFSVLAVILWLASIGLGMQVIASAQYLLTLLFVWAGGDYQFAQAIAWPLICLMAIGLIAFTLITGEYHRKRVGSVESWRLFAWSIGIELVILLIHYFVG